MIQFDKRGNIEIASFTINKINAFVSDKIRTEIIKEFENSGTKMIIDLKGVEYIDSTGFACFLSILKAAKNNYGILKFANAEPSVLALFETLHLHTVFEIYKDLDSGIKSFNK
jgi:anti-sigma B factor antagonist